MVYKKSPKSFSQKKSFFFIVTKKNAKIAFLRELSLNDFFFFLQICNFFKSGGFRTQNHNFSYFKNFAKKKKFKKLEIYINNE